MRESVNFWIEPIHEVVSERTEFTKKKKKKRWACIIKNRVVSYVEFHIF